jgi:hypothetical protein
MYAPILLPILIPILLALVGWLIIFVGKRRRQARAQLSRLRSAYPGAVIFEVSLTPGILNQVNVLRAASSPPLPPVVRENRPLLVSANRTGVTMWWGADLALHLDRQLVRATGTSVTVFQHPGTLVKSNVATVTIDSDWPDGRRFRLTLPLASPADERVVGHNEKLMALAEQIRAGITERLGLGPRV